jgi:hypothetical protein
LIRRFITATIISGRLLWKSDRCNDRSAQIKNGRGFQV